MISQDQAVLQVPIGANGTIALESGDGSDEHATRVEDVDGMLVTLALPTKRGVILKPPVGAVVSFTITEVGKGPRFYDGELLTVAELPLPVGVFRVLAVGSNQKRQYFRLTLALRPEICLLWEPAHGGAPAYWRPVSGVIQDLSAGGVRLTSSEPLEKGNRLRLRIPLPASADTLVADAEVVNVLEPTDGYTVGFAFGALERPQRERIAKYIHWYQVEARRTGRTRVSE